MNRKARRAARKGVPGNAAERHDVARLASYASARYADGALADAADALRKVIRLAPTEAAFHANLAVVLEQMGKADEAIAAGEKAIALDPDHPDAYYNLGVALAAGGRTAAAIAAYRQAIARHPGDVQAYGNLGTAWLGRRHVDDAAGVSRRAITLRPDWPQGHINLAAALKERGRIDEAVGECRQAIALEPDGAKPMADLAALLIGRGDSEKAIEACRRAIALSPDLLEARLYLGAGLKDQEDHAGGAVGVIDDRRQYIGADHQDALVRAGGDELGSGLHGINKGGAGGGKVKSPNTRGAQLVLDDAGGGGEEHVGRDCADDNGIEIAGCEAALGKRFLGGFDREVAGSYTFFSTMSRREKSDAGENPLVRRVDHLFEVSIGKKAGWHVGSGGADLHPDLVFRAQGLPQFGQLELLMK